MITILYARVVTLIAIALLPLQLFSCTSFFFIANDTLLFGNTMDISVGDGYVFINKRNIKKTGLWYSDAPVWSSKYASITTNMWGREFPARGMNEAGLVLGEMNLPGTIYPVADSRNCMELVQYMQYILDNCASVEDVLAYNEVVRIEQGQYESHFLISDANGHSIVIEWLNGILTSYSYNDLPVAVLTNNTYSSLLDYYNTGVAPGLYDVSSKGRFYKAADMIAGYNPETDGSAIDYGFKILNKIENAGFTKWRLLFDITNRRLYFDTYNHKKIRYVDLNYFDLSCTTPCKMINLYNLVEGNINAEMITFDYDINKTHLESFALKSGYGSPAWLSTYYDYPATTNCMGDLDVKVQTGTNNFIKSVIYRNGTISIDVDNNVTGPVTLNIYNSSGTRIGEHRINTMTETNLKIELNREQLSPGLLIICCTNNEMTDTHKVSVY